MPSARVFTPILALLLLAAGATAMAADVLSIDGQRYLRQELRLNQFPPASRPAWSWIAPIRRLPHRLGQPPPGSRHLWRDGPPCGRLGPEAGR